MEESLLSSEIVDLAFRLILGRGPESESTIAAHQKFATLQELREALFCSRESEVQAWTRIAERKARSIDEAISKIGWCGPIDAGNAPILIFQTADNLKYAEMLEWSSKTVKEFVKGKDIEYATYVGIRRGEFPHHATFNRIYVLNDYLEAGRKGWLLYMDADAYIYDLGFDLKGFLSSQKHSAFLFARADSAENCPYWNVNAGVFFANLSHPICGAIIRQWKDFYDVFYSSEDYKQATAWDDIKNDQTVLHQVLKCVAYDKYVTSTVEYKHIFNDSSARFIRQILRDDPESVDEKSFRKRMEKIQNDVTLVLGRNR